MGGSRKFCQWSEGGFLTTFSFSHQRISQRALRTFLKKQFDPRVQLLFEASVPVFLRIPKANCDFSEGPHMDRHILDDVS